MLYEKLLSHKTPLVRSSGGKPEREVQVGHSIFLNNLQEGKVSSLQMLLSITTTEKKSIQRERIYCTSAPGKRTSFIIIIRRYRREIILQKC